MTEYSAAQMEAFFNEHDPERASSTAAFLKLYAGHHDDMVKYLREQYGAIPAAAAPSDKKKRSIFGPMLDWGNKPEDSPDKRLKAQKSKKDDGENQDENSNSANAPNLWAKFQQSKQDLAFKVKGLTSSIDSETLLVQKKVADSLSLWQTPEAEDELFDDIVRATNEKSELITEQVCAKLSVASVPALTAFWRCADPDCDGRIKGAQVSEAANVHHQGAWDQCSLRLHSPSVLLTRLCIRTGAEAAASPGQAWIRLDR